MNNVVSVSVAEFSATLFSLCVAATFLVIWFTSF